MHKFFITGGHFTPAKAVVDELVRRGEEVFYVGRKHSLEGDKALSLEFLEMSERKDLTFLEITTGRLQRRFTTKTIPSLLKIPIGFCQSFYWLMKHRPNAVISFGGYVSIPISTVAYLLGIPVVNHEQVPAFDYPSKYLNKISRKVFVSFPHLVKNGEIYTGNPVRQEIFSKTKPHPKTIYITGGNQGSHTINKTILEIQDVLLEKYHLIWQTGDSREFKDFEKIPKRKNLLVKKFINSNEIGEVFANSDLVISRAGANTVTELAALGKPSILIPIPWVHDAEQQKNAEAIAHFGGSIIINQEELSPQLLLEKINYVFANLSAFKANSQKARALSIDNSAQKIVTETLKVLNEQKN